MATPFVTPVARLRYARSIWTARRFQNNPANAAKFSCTFVIAKNDPAMVAVIEEYNILAIEALGAGPAPAPGQLAVLPYGKKTCLMDGALRHPGDAFYADKWLLSAARAEEDGAPKVLLNPTTPVVDKGEIYDGVEVRGHVSFYPYKGGSGGINADLHGVMKVGDNERIGNSAPDSGSAFATAGAAGVAAPAAPVAAGVTAPTAGGLDF